MDRTIAERESDKYLDIIAHSMPWVRSFAPNVDRKIWQYIPEHSPADDYWIKHDIAYVEGDFLYLTERGAELIRNLRLLRQV